MYKGQESQVFIGVVSHEASRFVDARGLNGLAHQLKEAFSSLGIKCVTQINTKNFFDESSYALSPRMALVSVKAEIKLEKKWIRFLAKPKLLGEATRLAGRYAHFFRHLNKFSSIVELKRLLNIEYSHVNLYRAAIASGAQWAIILEDDAYSSDPVALAESLSELLMEANSAKVVSLSASFSLDELGIKHLLSVGHGNLRWRGPSSRIVYQASRPATNTVCAIGFRTSFLAEILADFESQPAEPVVPIDWKLNATLMRLWDAKKIGPDECWFIEPAPIIQLSMVRDREGR